MIAAQRMVLSLYVLPTIASAYFYGRRHGTLTAFASVLLVSGLLIFRNSVAGHRSSLAAGELGSGSKSWSGAGR